MICIDQPVQVAVVDRIEGDWARVELASQDVVDVYLWRLPVGVGEGALVCHCSSERWDEPVGFRGCPKNLDPVFTEKRRAQWSR